LVRWLIARAEPSLVRELAVDVGRLIRLGGADVERVLTILHDELLLAMRSCATASISEISASYVSRR
jgi:hypothetical protein